MTASPATAAKRWLVLVAATVIVALSAACGDPETPAASVESIDAGMVVAAVEEILGDIYDSAVPSVVAIRVERTQGLNSAGVGSGFVWSEDGHIVTNHHVVDNVDRIVVTFSDGSDYPAELLGSDQASDIAVLKIKPGDRVLRPLTLADSDDLRVGQTAVALGTPFGHRFTMTTGIVSAIGRTVRSGSSSYSNPEIVQTDAPLNPGNSGGPLLNRSGEVIGINAQISTPTGVNSGVGFAVPINTAKRVVPSLIQDGEYQYSYLGISAATLNADLAEANSLPMSTRGALLVDIVEDSPADEAGLVAGERQDVDGTPYWIGGDVVTAIDGVPVTGIDDLVTYLVTETRPGDDIVLDLIRQGGERTEVRVVLGSRPSVGAG